MKQYALKGVKYVRGANIPPYRTRFDRPHVKRADMVWFADHIDDAKLYKTKHQAEKARDAIHAGAGPERSPHWRDVRIVEVEVTREEV